MHAIFYDLETSDQNPIGQILNYSFIFVDDELEPLDECSGTIRISRLQLPRAGAILTNRVNVVEHQRQSRDSEFSAMRRIHEFISTCAKKAKKPIALIGFNSSNFDLPFLRTSFIRNGLNPFFKGQQVLERDLLLSIRKLALCDTRFPRIATKDDPGKLCLRLENLGHALGLLTGKQSHDSREDVILSIALAKYCRDTFGFDAVSYLAYEGGAFEPRQRQPDVFSMLELNYDLSCAERSIIKPVTLLDCNYRASIWVDLEAYKNGRGRQSLRNIKKLGGHSAWFAAESQLDPSWREWALKAQTEFRAINLDNFFGPTECDIEANIWRLDASDREALFKAIHKGDESEIQGVDAKVILLRHKLRSYEWGSGDDHTMEKALRNYALRRYGGETFMSKIPRSEVKEENRAEYYHPTLKMLFDEISEERKNRTSPDDTTLLAALEQFYLESDIYRVAGSELLARGSLSRAA